MEYIVVDALEEHYPDVKSIAMGKDDIMLVVTGTQDASWHIAATVWKHNAKTNSKEGKFSEELVSPYYSISADPYTGYAFVGTSDYSTNGDVYFFDASGRLVDRFDTQGLNPQKCLFLSIMINFATKHIFLKFTSFCFN